MHNQSSTSERKDTTQSDLFFFFSLDAALDLQNHYYVPPIPWYNSTLLVFSTLMHDAWRYFFWKIAIRESTVLVASINVQTLFYNPCLDLSAFIAPLLFLWTGIPLDNLGSSGLGLVFLDVDCFETDL